MAATLWLFSTITVTLSAVVIPITMCETLFNYKLNNQDIIKNSTIPKIVYESNTVRIWHLKDTIFLEQKVYLYFKIVNPLRSSSLANYVRSEIFIKMIADNIYTSLKDVKLRATPVNIISLPSGFSMFFKDQKDRIPKIAADSFRSMMMSNLDHLKNVFLEAKKQCIEDLKITTKDLECLTSLLSSDLLQSPSKWKEEEILLSLRGTTYEQIERFRQEFFSMLHLEIFAYGSIEKDEAIKVLKDVFGSIQNHYNVKPFISSEIKKPKALVLPEGSYFLFNTEVNNSNESAVHLILQMPPAYNLRAKAIQAMIFYYLRHFSAHTWLSIYTTPLGFSIRRLNGIYIVEYFARGLHTTPNDIESRMEADLQAVQQSWLKIFENDFERDKLAYVNMIMGYDDLDMDDVAQRFWQEIKDEDYNFDKSGLANAILNVSKEDVTKCYQENFLDKSPKRRKLVIHVNPASNQTMTTHGARFKTNKKATLITSVTKFKNSMPFYSLLKEQSIPISF